jgi:hypothetical protein
MSSSSTKVDHDISILVSLPAGKEGISRFAYRRTGVAQALPASVYQAVAEMQLMLPPVH